MKDTGIIKGEPTQENGLIPVELGDGTVIYAQWIPNSEPTVGLAVEIERTAAGSMLATAKNSYNFNQLFQQSGLQKFAKRASWDVDFANGKVWNEPMSKPLPQPQIAFFLEKSDSFLVLASGLDTQYLIPVLSSGSYIYSCFYGNYDNWSAGLVQYDSNQEVYKIVFLENGTVLGHYAEEPYTDPWSAWLSDESLRRYVHLSSDHSSIYSTLPYRGAIVYGAEQLTHVNGADTVTYGNPAVFVNNHKWFNLDGTASEAVSFNSSESLNRESSTKHLLKKSTDGNFGLFLEQEKTIESVTGVDGIDLYFETKATYSLSTTSGLKKLDQSPFLLGFILSPIVGNTVEVSLPYLGYTVGTSTNGTIVTRREKRIHPNSVEHNSNPDWLIGMNVCIVTLNQESGAYSEYEGVVTSYRDGSYVWGSEMTVTITTGPTIKEFDYWGFYYNQICQAVVYTKNSESIFSVLFAPTLIEPTSVNPPLVGGLTTGGYNISSGANGNNYNWLQNLKMLNNGDLLRFQPIGKKAALDLKNLSILKADRFSLTYNQEIDTYKYTLSEEISYPVDVDLERYVLNGWDILGVSTDYE